MIVNSIKLSNVVFNKAMGIGSIALRIMDPHGIYICTIGIHDVHNTISTDINNF